MFSTTATFTADSGRRGLANLTERARLRGGECLITSSPDAGTTVVWTVPLPDEEDSP